MEPYNLRNENERNRKKKTISHTEEKTENIIGTHQIVCLLLAYLKEN